MGEVIFWKFIFPKFFEVQRIGGCEYAFLFVADLSEDRTLINYYNVALKENRKAYFENLNIDKNDKII